MMQSLKQGLARCAYSWLWRLLTPAYVLKLRLRARKEPAYWQHIAQRFGIYKNEDTTPNQGGYVWVHAVSLGETRAAQVLINALREKIPNMKLLLTHSTATGREQGAALLQDGDVQCWLPIDTPGGVQRFMERFRPCIGLLMETEIWPNVMHVAQKMQIPMILVNARLSERSLKGMQKASVLLRPAYEGLYTALAQTADDAKRLKKAGVSNVKVFGNLKYDMQPAPDLLEQGKTWKLALKRSVVMAASTREGEEVQLLEAWQKAPWRILPVEYRPILLIVPRHPQRFEDVAKQISDSGLSFNKRSSWAKQGPCEKGGDLVDVWLGDSLREMPMYYALADMVLLGGSFQCYGGQNLLEALACANPVIMGEHTFNFKLACELASKAGVAYKVVDFQQALAQVYAWLQAPEELTKLQERSEAFILEHQGAAENMAVYIMNLIESRL